MRITSELYVDFLRAAYDRIHANETYVTDLDLATGDGDHWSNLDKGFRKLVEMRDELAGLPLNALFQKIGMTMMATIGGSSGVLYGGAYIAAGKGLNGKEALDGQGLCDALEAMLNDIMACGKVKVGFKTMIDALAPAVETFRLGLSEGLPEAELLTKVKAAAEAGAESTRAMEAVRGRATYQSGKGVGHLDPGAVTMSYQVGALCDVILASL